MLGVAGDALVMAWDGTRSGRPEESLVARLQQHSLAATVQGAMQTTAARIKTRNLAQTGTRWGSATRKGPGSGDGWCWRIGPGWVWVARGPDAYHGDE